MTFDETLETISEIDRQTLWDEYHSGDACKAKGGPITRFDDQTIIKAASYRYGLNQNNLSRYSRPEDPSRLDILESVAGAAMTEFLNHDRHRNAIFDTGAFYILGNEGACIMDIRT